MAHVVALKSVLEDTSSGAKSIETKEKITHSKERCETFRVSIVHVTTELTQIHRLLQQGRAQEAVERCHALLKDHPENVEILHYLGLGYLHQQQWAQAEHYLLRTLRAATPSASLLNEIGIARLKQEAYEDAIDFFARALDLAPAHTDALNNMAAIFIILQQPAKARSYLERLMLVLPFSADVHVKAADNSLELNNVEQAIRRGRKAVKLAPHHLPARLSLAEALEAGGRFKQAKFQYLSVIARQPGHVVALSKLLALRGTQLDGQYHHQALQALNQPTLGDEERVQLHLGLARFYDQGHAYERAFEHLQIANGMKFRNHPFDSALHSQAINRLMAVFTKDFFQSLPSHGVKTQRPIFIVGMPRSGTTLVEQILASHSRVAAGGELPTIISIAVQLGTADRMYPERVRDLDGSALAQKAQQYLDKLRIISVHADRVTDKMPFNYMHLGLIQSLFPGATIIHCRRDPLDTCLSCFFTTFTDSLQFASDLPSLARYYVDYRRLMAHWRSVLPVPWLELQYERLVSDTEEVIKGLLGFCGIEWEPACVQFYETRRGVRTPSRWQVRQPMYGHSVGRWRPYERQLWPLREILLQQHITEDTERLN